MLECEKIEFILIILCVSFVPSNVCFVLFLKRNTSSHLWMFGEFNTIEMENAYLPDVALLSSPPTSSLRSVGCFMGFHFVENWRTQDETLQNTNLMTPTLFFVISSFI
ncbi:uncharacterized protein [Parasteatoda tepidariorum]|uniref:uncharacterized protein n=1 Tax=Parasteatoda tepidariorum TaxID=114398 RepID=UPI00077FD36E|nr:uncharacterized protein LOC107455196 [Parasteatoda tepidariorum]